MLLSIHVNASPNENACGLETYFPDTASSSADAGKLAGLENANGGHKGDTGSPAASSSVRSQESRRLADTVQKCTLSVMKEKTFTVRDGGVKSGPFKVLLGANIPGILVEVGYCSNAQEAANLAIPTYGSVGGRDRFRHPCPFGQPRREQALIPFRYAFFPVWQHFLPSPVPLCLFHVRFGKRENAAPFSLSNKPARGAVQRTVICSQRSPRKVYFAVKQTRRKKKTQPSPHREYP